MVPADQPGNHRLRLELIRQVFSLPGLADRPVGPHRQAERCQPLDAIISVCSWVMEACQDTIAELAQAAGWGLPKKALFRRSSG
jgi:hypothetical protein